MTWNPFAKKKSIPSLAAPRPRTISELADALIAAKRRLAIVEDDDAARRALGLAESLLVAVGENPSTLENQVIAHQMAIEQLRIGRTPAQA